MPEPIPADAPESPRFDYARLPTEEERRALVEQLHAAFHPQRVSTLDASEDLGSTIGFGISQERWAIVTIAAGLAANPGLDPSDAEFIPGVANDAALIAEKCFAAADRISGERASDPAKDDERSPLKRLIEDRGYRHCTVIDCGWTGPDGLTHLDENGRTCCPMCKEPIRS